MAMGSVQNESPLKSITSQIPFVNDFEPLPASTPINHAHIINLSEYNCNANKQPIKIQDAVATTLFNISPATLESFLSPRIHTFKAIFGKRDTQLVIWRKGLEVFIGAYEHHTSLKVYGFEYVAGLLIGYDGSWHLKATASNAYANSKWNEIWTGRFASYGGVGEMRVEVEEEGMKGQAERLAERVLEKRFWEMKTEVKIA